MARRLKKKMSHPVPQVQKKQEVVAIPDTPLKAASEILELELNETKQIVASPDRETSIEPLLLNVSDVCALLNISRSTLLRLEKTGSVPGRLKLGGQVRYHRGIIETWLQSLATASQENEK
jgi:predicted DNA-binding transcriptional regulator AlpA